MASTRFHDDDIRVWKQLQTLSYVGKYQLDVPGNGMHLPFMEDPTVRLQKYGCNLRTNTVNIESDLYGMTRKSNRDEIEGNDYTRHQAESEVFDANAPVETTYSHESRSDMPAWTLRGIEIPRWERPFLNPQAKLEKTFRDNVSTRLLEKDVYVEQHPSLFLRDN